MIPKCFSWILDVPTSKIELSPKRDAHFDKSPFSSQGHFYPKWNPKGFQHGAKTPFKINEKVMSAYKVAAVDSKKK